MPSLDPCLRSSFSTFKYYISKFGLHDDEDARTTLDLIQNGSKLLLDPVELRRDTTVSFCPSNGIKNDGEERVVREEFKEEIEASRMAGPFTRTSVEKVVGPIRNAPMSLVPKGKKKEDGSEAYRIVENLSFPRTPRSDDVRSVNSYLEPDDCRCSFSRFVDIVSFMRRVAQDPHARIMGIDISKAFHHLPLHPSIRPFFCLSLGDEFFIRKVAPFGARSTPAIFLATTRTTQEIFRRVFGDRADDEAYMDDHAVALFDPTLDEDEVHSFFDELGWADNKSKGTPAGRWIEHVGVEFDLNLQTMRIPERKRVKYLAKVVSALETFGTGKGIQKKLWESLVGSLQYVGFVLPKTRSHLSVLYAFLRAYPDSKFATRRIEHREKRELEWWRNLLSPGADLSTSFAAAPPAYPGYFACDASDNMLGIYLRLGAKAPVVYTRAWSLVEGWRDVYASRAANIFNPEAWAVEALLEIVVRIGAKECTVVVYSDNTTVIQAFEKGWSRNALLNASIARLNNVSSELNIHLSLRYVRSADNPADAVSRGVTVVDAEEVPFPSHPPPGTQGGPDVLSRVPSILSSL